jgi:BirA family biotin operon repressor/biotin-[acetyl-CoA-carboxylase] ligase
MSLRFADTIDWRHFGCLDSTNAEAQRLLASGELTHPTAILAEAQTAGRGTQGRAWRSPPGAGLYLSLAYPASALPLSAITRSAPYTLAAAVATAEALERLCGLRVGFKPVNDLIHHQHKLGGILVETRLRNDSEGICGLIVGIGVNVRSVDRPVHQPQFPPAAVEDFLPAGQTLPEPRALAEALLEDWAVQCDVLWQGRTTAVLSAWRARVLPDFSGEADALLQELRCLNRL